ncbi:hypothetical protein BWO91_17670 [Plantibacter flavus]|uniref:hypothetical protein n=1 Tax=Plantibacter flavus TaxID=150123 RepID=UPI00099C8AB7|nr:hypothetical protein [Plantibacter flavus]AQX81549.1 hypothetical protein BWO91_17670 [Plantibacter flavus]
MSAVATATAAFLAAASIVAAPAIITAETERAQLSVAITDLANLAAAQQISIAIDGLYAPSLDALRDSDVYGVEGLSLNVDLRSDGAEVFYAPTGDRTGYVIGTLLPNGGGVVLSSDENSNAVWCETFAVECVAQVTDRVELINAVPQWVPIAPR